MTAPTPISDLASWLCGRWRVEREINRGAGAFIGIAVFEPEGTAGLVWRETGQLRLDGHEGPARRTLTLAPVSPAALASPTDADRGWLVRFDDGRSFHALDLRTGRCAAEHLCGPDIYRGVYAVEDPDRFTVTWHVVGPRRDDVIASSYTRASSQVRT